MHIRLAIPLLLVLSGCATLFGDNTRHFSIYFQPYSADLDDHARATVIDAASFAQSHGYQPIAVTGFSAPPDSAKDIEGLSAQRADVVKQALVTNGVGAGRITVTAAGITDPEGLPNLAVRRVDIAIGK